MKHTLTILASFSLGSFVSFTIAFVLWHKDSNHSSSISLHSRVANFKSTEPPPLSLVSKVKDGGIATVKPDTPPFEITGKFETDLVTLSASQMGVLSPDVLYSDSLELTSNCPRAFGLSEQQVKGVNSAIKKFASDLSREEVKNRELVSDAQGDYYKIKPYAEFQNLIDSLRANVNKVVQDTNQATLITALIGSSSVFGARGKFEERVYIKEDARSGGTVIERMVLGTAGNSGWMSTTYTKEFVATRYPGFFLSSEQIK